MSFTNGIIRGIQAFATEDYSVNDGRILLANSVGNKLSGILASTWYNYENKEYYFLVNFGLLIFAFFIGLLMLKFLNKVMKEKGLN